MSGPDGTLLGVQTLLLQERLATSAPQHLRLHANVMTFATRDIDDNFWRKFTAVIASFVGGAVADVAGAGRSGNATTDAVGGGEN